MKLVMKIACAAALLMTAAACGGSGGDETSVQPDTSSASTTMPSDSSSVDIEPVGAGEDTLPDEVLFSMRENGLGLCLIQADLPCPNSDASFFTADSVMISSPYWQGGSSSGYCLLSRRESDSLVIHDTFAVREMVESLTRQGRGDYQFEIPTGCILGAECASNSGTVRGKRMNFEVYRDGMLFMGGTACVFWHRGFLNILLGKITHPSYEVLDLIEGTVDRIGSNIYFGEPGQPRVDRMHLGPPGYI